MSYLLICLLVILLDQGTKYAVSVHLPLYSAREVIPHVFNVVHVTNPGAAFSFLAGHDGAWRHYFFLAVGCIAVAVISGAWYKTHREAPLQGMGLALIAGGACGNLIDRLLRGEVIDFLDFYFRSYHWPTFNVADISICVGVAVVLLTSLLEKK